MSFLFTHLQLLGNVQAQVVKTKWLLSVELHQFHNLYNAEVINGLGFCCCDVQPLNSNYLYYCEAELKHLLGCNSSCDTWLNASVSHCIEPNPCSFSTEVRFGTASIDNFNEKFIFVLSSFSDVVRVTKGLCTLH